MPEPTNPYAPSPEWNPGADTYTQADAVVWSECDFAWRSWLASDEAVERVAGALAGPAPCHCSDDPRHTLGSVRCPQHGQGEWPRDRHRTAARAVLAALRGDET